MPFANPFPPATHADWLAQVQKDLKDPNAYETLRWPTPEGFTLEPYYTAEQAGMPTASQPAQRTQPGWLNAPAYTVSDARTDNATLRDALANGADALTLHVPGPVRRTDSDGPPRGSDGTAADLNLSLLLNGIKLSETPIFFTVEGDANAFVQALRQVAPYQLRGGLSSAPEHQLAVMQATADSPQFRTVTIDGAHYHNAGGTATQELAFTLAQLADTFDRLTDAGLAPDQLAQKTVVQMAVGTSYFVEIAKLRALRVLLARFSSAYSFLLPPSSFLLHVTTSPFHESTATPYTNLLRATTEAMAAVIGGGDVLTVRPYDAVTGNTSAFSQRIARNISVLLRDEGYMDKIADPAAGSYYIETLTGQLVDAAWALFLQVEARGGLAKAAGYVQNELDTSYQAKVEAVQQGRMLVGVTKFRFDEGEPKPIRFEGERISSSGRRLAESFE